VKLYFLGELVGEFLWQVFGYASYGVGRLVVPVMTAGWARPAEVRDEKLMFSWGVARGRDGKAVLSDWLTMIAGLAAFIVVIAAVTWVLNASRQPRA